MNSFSIKAATMKIQLILFFSLSLFILTAAAFDPIRIPTATDTVFSGYPVVDINGNDLISGSEYYMSTYISRKASGQGVSVAQLENTTTCPNDVVQLRSLDLGDPVVFTPAEKSTLVIPSTFQAISFTAAAATEECADKLSWKVEYDEQFGRQLMKVGEAEENVSNLFKIELVEWSLKAYKLTYCPKDEDKCYDVGGFYDSASSAMRLALTNSTGTLIVFKKK